MSHKEVQVFDEDFLNIQNKFFKHNFFNYIEDQLRFWYLKLKISFSRSKNMSKSLRK